MIHLILQKFRKKKVFCRLQYFTTQTPKLHICLINAENFGINCRGDHSLSISTKTAITGQALLTLSESNHWMYTYNC